MLLSHSSPSTRRLILSISTTFSVLFLYLVFCERRALTPYLKDVGTEHVSISANPSMTLRKCELPHLLAGRLDSILAASPTETSDLRPIFGIPNFFGNASMCYKVENRLEPYGWGEDDEEWENIDWGFWQKKCVAANADKTTPAIPIYERYILPSQTTQPPKTSVYSIGKPRSAIVLRTTEDAEYDGDVLAYFRSMIVEMNLLTGGEYEVMLLVETKNSSLEIFSNPTMYYQVLAKAVPAELRGMTYLWSRKAMEEWYPNIEEHGFNQQAYQALQPFVKYMRPEFDFYWHWETDIRFSGPLYRMHEQITTWAKRRSRIHLNAIISAWYTPDVHGPYEHFVATLQSQIEQEHKQQTGASLHSAYGVGEEAELIAFMPIIDEHGTRGLSQDVYHNDFMAPNLPIRTQGTASARISKHLFELAHDLQTRTNIWITADTFYTTLAERYQLKSVFVPHPFFSDTDVPVEELSRMFNPGPTANLGGGEESQYNTGTERHHILSRMSWWWQTYDKVYPLDIWTEFLKGKCLPAALWHPVKTKKAAEALEHVP